MCIDQQLLVNTLRLPADESRQLTNLLCSVSHTRNTQGDVLNPRMVCGVEEELPSFSTRRAGAWRFHISAITLSHLIYPHTNGHNVAKKKKRSKQIKKKVRPSARGEIWP